MDLSFLAGYINDIVAIATGVATLLGLWWGFAKWLLPLLRDIHKSFTQLDVIASEFRTNGGSSLRDVANRLEAGLKTVSQDIKDVREDALKMEARQWAIIATLKDPIFESNPDGLCVRANPSYLSLVERTMEDVVGNGWENILHPDDRVRVWSEWQDAIERQRTFESSYKIRSASGVIYQVLCVAIPYFSSEDTSNPIGYIGRFEKVKKLP